MRHGLYLPNCGEFSEVRVLAGLAGEAEASGWDGFFLWDTISPPGDGTTPAADPWVALTVVALCTERLRIGTMVTPLARRRPTKLARETVTIDRLSGGRLVLGVGLGGPETGAEPEFGWLGDETDNRIRAEKLDEGLEILVRLWSGSAVEFSGKHYRVHQTTFQPTPLQSPRIPIWVGGTWPGTLPFQRAARFDGLFPANRNWDQGGYFTPSDIQNMRTYVDRFRSDVGRSFDIVMMPSCPDNLPRLSSALAAEYEEAGVTWWLHNASEMGDASRLSRQGP